jgi:hypothetical protein
LLSFCSHFSSSFCSLIPHSFLLFFPGGLR